MVHSLHSVTTGSRDRANVSLIIIIIEKTDCLTYTLLVPLYLHHHSFYRGVFYTNIIVQHLS